MIDSLPVVGALATCALGLLGLLAPNVAAAFTSLRPEGLLGRSEIRATYGGLFLALGAGALVLRSPEVFLMLGLAWLGAAAGRLVSVVVDRSTEVKNFGGIAFEGAIGLLFLAPRLAGA